MKLNNIEKDLDERFFKPKEKFENNIIEEKPKMNAIKDKLTYDEPMKSNEKTELKSKRSLKHKHILDIEFDKK